MNIIKPPSVFLSMVYTDKTMLVADTVEELHDFAASIGISREHYRDHDEYPHYEIWGYKVDKAFEKGAFNTRTCEVLILSMQISRKGANDPGILAKQIDKLLEYDGYMPRALPRILLNRLYEKINHEAENSATKPL